jgi:hypothetical protein
MQRHHILPRQLLLNQQLCKMFDSVGNDRIGFDDFRLNGLLLPAMEQASLVLGLPLHRGPHRIYNEVVTERVGQIEASWCSVRRRDEESAQDEVLLRMRLLQRALRRRLLEPGWRRLKLSSNDPLGQGVDFSRLDAMADALWSATDAVRHNP